MNFLEVFFFFPFQQLLLKVDFFFRFPPKEDVVDFVVKKTHNCLKKQPRTLVVVGAYSIGKENVYLAISQSLEVKTSVVARKTEEVKLLNLRSGCILPSLN